MRSRSRLKAFTSFTTLAAAAAFAASTVIAQVENPTITKCFDFGRIRICITMPVY